MLRPASLFFLFCLIGTCAHGESIDWTGVWSGTLGHQTVLACNNGNGSGSYHHTDLLQAQPLKSTDGQWQEGETGILWTLTELAGDTLAGSRQNPDNGVVEALTLRRLNNASSLPPCARPDYQAPLLRDRGIITSPQRTFEDHTFRRLSAHLGWHAAIRVETVELLGDTAVIRRINHELRAALPQQDSDWNPLRQCAGQGLASSGEAALYLEQTTITFWTSGWLALQNTLQTRCGTEQETRVWGYRTLNLATGEQIDPWTWFGLKEAFPEQPHRRGWARLPAALRRMVHRGWPVEDECRTEVHEYSWYSVRPGVLGLVFERMGLSPACTDEIEVSWARLQPILTVAGKAAIRSLSASIQ